MPKIRPSHFGEEKLFIDVGEDDISENSETKLYSVYKELDNIEIEGFRENDQIVTCSASEFGEGKAKLHQQPVEDHD